MKTYAFPRQSRMLAAGDFRNVFSGAKFKASSRYLLILASPGLSKNSRLGLVFAKKNVRFAVQRNRLKRLVRESFRLRQHQLPDLDFVVMARKGLDQLDNNEIVQTLDKLWYRLQRNAEEARASTPD